MNDHVSREAALDQLFVALPDEVLIDETARQFDELFAAASCPTCRIPYDDQGNCACVGAAD